MSATPGANGNLHAIAIKEKKKFLKTRIIMALFRRGSFGMEVRQIQAQLTKLGYYRGAVDGRFGTETQNAVLEFQRANKLNGDGNVGPQTWRVLFATDAPLSCTQIPARPLSFNKG